MAEHLNAVHVQLLQPIFTGRWYNIEAGIRMTNTRVLQLSLSEVCQVTSLPSETISDLVNEGIVEPTGNTPESWQFDVHMLNIIRKAMRLHRDLDINWPGIAFAISLIDEMELLRQENEKLQRSLNQYSPY